MNLSERLGDFADVHCATMGLVLSLNFSTGPWWSLSFSSGPCGSDGKYSAWNAGDRGLFG